MHRVLCREMQAECGPGSVEHAGLVAALASAMHVLAMGHRLFVSPHVHACLQGVQQDRGDEARQKDASACMLALAMLASFCRVPDLAAEQDVLDKVPLLLKARRTP